MVEQKQMIVLSVLQVLQVHIIAPVSYQATQYG